MTNGRRQRSERTTQRTALARNATDEATQSTETEGSLSESRLAVLSAVGLVQSPGSKPSNAGFHGKPSNPKDIIGSGKLPLDLVPDSLAVFAAMGFLEGALKYGRFNWRKTGVRSSIYIAAARRHLAKWFNGEDVDPRTEVPHLASALACIGIVVDASVSDKLVDDRPPAQRGLGERIDQSDALVRHLKELFKDHDPKQYTIEDSE